MFAALALGKLWCVVPDLLLGESTMRRWLRQTDTLIFMTLAVGLFLFRFGDETWAAVSLHLVRAQNAVAAQFDKVTTSITSNATLEDDTSEVVTGTPTIGGPRFPAGFQPGPIQTHIIIGPSCPSGSPYGCHH